MDSFDHSMHRALMKILDEGTFPLMAKEVPAFAQVYAWAKNMPANLVKKEVAKKGKSKCQA